MSFDAYKVAVKLTLVNGVGAGLSALAAQMAVFNRHVISSQHSVSALERQLMSLKRIGIIGGGMAAAGGFGLSMLRAPLEEAKKFQTEAAKFGSLGFGDATNRQAEQFASGMKTIGTSARENMALLGDAMSVFKDLGEAKMVTPLMAKMKFANAALFGADGGERDSKLMDMMKVVEFRGGLKSPEEFAKQANMAQQAITGSRNRVDPSAMLQALKTGGVGLSRRSNDAFYLGGEPLIQEFGGSRYGTAVMSIYQNLVQSRGTITAQQELYRLGLLNKDKVQFNQLGKLKKALPGAFKGGDVLESQGELALLEKVLLPAFAAKGITSEGDVLQELGMILGNRTGSALMARIYQQREKLHMQTDANRHAENIDQATSRASGTLEGREIDLHKKWATVMKELGTAILPIAIKAVSGLTAVLRGVINFAHEWPTLTKWLTIGFGVLAGIVGVGGVLLTAVAGFKALGLVLSLSGAGGGLGGALMAAAGGLSTFAATVIPLAAALGVGLVAGSVINDHLSGGTKDAIGAHIAGFLGMLGSKDDAETYQKYRIQQAIDKKADFVKSHNITTASGKVDVYLDGKKVSEIITGHQAKSATRQTAGATVFDHRMMPRPAGA